MAEEQEQCGKTPLTVDDILGSTLYGQLIQATGEAAPLSRRTIWMALRAAEDAYEHDLGTYLQIRRIASDPFLRQMDPADYDVDEPAYNHEPDLWTEYRWSFLQTRRRPVEAIDKITFAYPMQEGPIDRVGFVVPPIWIRVDRRSGQIHLIPTGPHVIIASFNAYVLSMIAAGRGVPRSIFIDYRAGLGCDALLNEYSYLLGGIAARTFLKLAIQLSTARTGNVTSHSISQDGQSQSESFGGGKWGPLSGLYEIAKDRDDSAIKTFRNAVQEPRLMVM
jgi:hypothetical protein